MAFMYALLIIASVFFYILYEPAFSFYLCAFLFIIPIVTFIMTLYTARRTTVAFTEQQTTAGRAAKLPIGLRVVNNSPLPCANLLIEIEYCNLLDGKNSVVKINTPVYPHETQQMTLTVSGVHCGTVRFRIKRCRMTDMLKLFNIRLRRPRRELDDGCTLTILPEYVPLENSIANYADMGLETDEYSKTQKGDDPSEIFDIRDYVDGDKLNRVHWKLTAKQDKTMVKDYSLPISNSIVLMLDPVTSRNKDDDLILFDTLVETVASISNYLLENSVPHRVVYYDNVHSRLMELNISDEESHGTMIGMLLQAQFSAQSSLALTGYINKTENFMCGHLVYLSTSYNPNATELMNDAELAHKYSYLLMSDDNGGPVEIYDEYAQLIPVYSGKLSESIQELYL